MRVDNKIIITDFIVLISVYSAQRSVLLILSYLFLYTVPNEVCFQVEPDLSHCNEECVLPCIVTDQGIKLIIKNNF